MNLNTRFHASLLSWILPKSYRECDTKQHVTVSLRELPTVQVVALVGQESLKFIRTNGHVKNTVSFITAICCIDSPLMVCAYKVQMPSRFSFMMCEMLKVVNAGEGEIILGGLGKGEEDLIRNDIAKGKRDRLEPDNRKQLF